eukprot:scaffold31899_cov17-Tisochrysis_lutea.AAC.2
MHGSYPRLPHRLLCAPIELTGGSGGACLQQRGKATRTDEGRTTMRSFADFTHFGAQIPGSRHASSGYTSW